MAEQDLLTDRLEISWGRGWGVYNVACPMCGHRMAVIAAIGDPPGFNCTRCEHIDPEFDWHGQEDEMANDGAWLAPIYNPVMDIHWARGEGEA